MADLEPASAPAAPAPTRLQSTVGTIVSVLVVLTIVAAGIGLNWLWGQPMIEAKKDWFATDRGQATCAYDSCSAAAAGAVTFRVHQGTTETRSGRTRYVYDHGHRDEGHFLCAEHGAFARRGEWPLRKTCWYWFLLLPLVSIAGGVIPWLPVVWILTKLKLMA